MANLCVDVDLEDTLKDTSLPFYALIDKDTEVYYEDFKSVVEARQFRYRRKEAQSVDITESSKTELVKSAEAKRKGRSRFIKVYYQGVMNTKGWIYFKTTSQYTKNKMYTQYIRINEAEDFKYFKEFDKRDIVRLFMSGDLSVYCSCPDFLYRGYKYMGYNMGYGIFKENRFPKIRNPQLEGTVCKHLIAVLKVFGMHWSSVAKDMVKTKYWKKRYE